LNRYAYVEGSPVEFRDSDGHALSFGLVVAIGAGVGAVAGGGYAAYKSKKAGNSWQSKQLWKDVGKGAAEGAVIGAGVAIIGYSAVISPTGAIAGSLNAYYVYKRGGTKTDIAVAYGLGWVIGSGLDGLGGQMVSDGFYPVFAYALQGYAISANTQFWTEVYLGVKRQNKDEFKWREVIKSAGIGAITGPLGHYGKVIGGEILGEILTIIFSGNENYNEKLFDEIFKINQKTKRFSYHSI
jgi:hypothetical protein